MLTDSKQRTIAQVVQLEGVGLHTGQKASVKFVPAEEGAGIVFVRDGIEIPAQVSCVCNTHFYTSLAIEGGPEIKQVEHVLAALCLCGIDNIRVHLDGPEMPILDGSAHPYVIALGEAGIMVQSVDRRNSRKAKGFQVVSGESCIRYTPANDLRIHVTIDYPGTVIGKQQFIYSPDMQPKEIARARTFCRHEEIDALRAQGLGLGGTLDNTVVVDGSRILNAGGLRYPDEFARHKALDMLGDLQMIGGPIQGHIEAYRPGHTINQQFAREFLRQIAAGMDGYWTSSVEKTGRIR